MVPAFNNFSIKHGSFVLSPTSVLQRGKQTRRPGESLGFGALLLLPVFGGWAIVTHVANTEGAAQQKRRGYSCLFQANQPSNLKNIKEHFLIS